MITAYYKPTLGAFVYTNRKRHLLSMTAIAAYLARVSWINSFKRPASVLSFAFRHLEKAPPSHVADCLSETAIPDHPAYVQILDCDRVESSDQIGRYLMMEILTTARDLQMRFGHFDSLLGAALRSLFLCRFRKASCKRQNVVGAWRPLSPDIGSERSTSHAKSRRNSNHRHRADRAAHRATQTRQAPAAGCAVD